MLCDDSLELIDLKMSTKNKVIFDTTKFCNFYLILIADPCYNYQNLSDAKRKSSYVTSKDGPSLCDNLLLEGWYRFVGAAGTKMPTTRVSAYRCGTGRSGWLDDAHPTVEDVEVQKNVCFSDRVEGCKFRTSIFVKKKKNVGPTSSTSFFCHLDVTHATVVQIECEATEQF